LKFVLLAGVAAAITTIVGGVFAWRWLIGAGGTVLLLVIIVLPWLRTDRLGVKWPDR
jgi:hypothetical protein